LREEKEVKLRIPRLIIAVSCLASLSILAVLSASCGGDDEEATPTLAAATSTQVAPTAVVTKPASSTPATGAALTVVNGDQSKTLSLEEIEALPAKSGWGGMLTSSGAVKGPFQYKGVALMDILATVGGIKDGDKVKVIAKDNYATTFSYKQVAEGDFVTMDAKTKDEASPDGEVVAILAYEENGALVGESAGPLRIAILSGEDFITEGNWWAKFVVKIEVGS